MDIRNKLYPYPMLADNSDDYGEDSYFRSEILAAKDGYKLRFDMNASTNVPELNDLISQNMAAFVYHIECSPTGLRTAIETTDPHTTHYIDDKMVNGKIQICPFIVAKQPIPNYSSSNFIEDYAEIDFEIEEGCILATGKQVNIIVNKTGDIFANTPSIFRVIRNADVTVHTMIVEMDGNLILIKLPLEDFFKYKSIVRNSRYIPLLNAVVLVPSLQYVLSELKYIVSDAVQYNYQDFSWYKTLYKKIQELAGIDFINDPDSFRDIDTLELSQKLLNSPLSEAFDILNFDEDYEEDT